MKYFIAVLFLLTASPVFAAECQQSEQFASAEVSTKADADANKISDVHVMKTVEEVDKFLLFFNETYGKNIPMGRADHAITFIKVTGNNKGLWVFGYKNGCQMGFIYVPTKSEKMNLDGQVDA